MMTTRYKITLKKILTFLFFSLFSYSAFCAEDSNWVVSAQKFDFVRGQKPDGITAPFTELYPQLILDKLGTSANRFIEEDELLQRTYYESRKNRLSLYLQLSSEYKKRDAFVLEDLSEKELKRKIEEENIKIKEIQSKIDDNLKKLAEEEEKILSGKENSTSSKNGLKSTANVEADKFSRMLRNMFSAESEIPTVEKISVTRDSKTNYPILFSPTDAIKDLPYNHSLYEKAVVNAKINMLLTGNISKYGDYVLLTVDAYLYPGSKKIGTVSEIGALGEIEWLTTSLALQLTPLITNSQPVVLNLDLNSEKDVLIYLDEKLQDSTKNQIVTESGVHTLLFTKKGCKSVGTSYFFEGNRYYNISVVMEAMDERILNLELKTDFEGELYANGSLTKKYMDNKSSIVINGDSVLGQFISEDGLTAPFYVTEELLNSTDYVSVKVKPIDRDKYIDGRRKWMYGAYSLLVVSLIPNFITLGNYENLVNAGIVDEKTMGWKTANTICTGVSIGLGALFVYELVRYFMAADTVIPKKAVLSKPFELTPIPEVIQETADDEEVKTDVEIDNEQIVEVEE